MIEIIDKIQCVLFLCYIIVYAKVWISDQFTFLMGKIEIDKISLTAMCDNSAICVTIKLWQSFLFCDNSADVWRFIRLCDNSAFSVILILKSVTISSKSVAL